MKVVSLPTFYQAVTDNLFKQLILAQSAVEKPELQSVQPVTCEEMLMLLDMLLAMFAVKFMRGEGNLADHTKMSYCNLSLTWLMLTENKSLLQHQLQRG